MLPRGLRIRLDQRRHRHGPWAALFEDYQGEELVSLDCETSCADPRRADILSIGAVRIQGRRILTSEALDLKLAPPEELDEASLLIHRLRRQDLHGGLGVDEAIDRTLGFIGNRPILGYHIRFDIAVLDRQLRNLHGFGLPNRAVELADTFVKRCGRPGDGIEGDLRLETIARKLDMPVPKGRHAAYLDALFVATLYVRLMHGDCGR